MITTQTRRKPVLMLGAALILTGTTFFSVSCARNSYEVSLNQLPERIRYVAEREIEGGQITDIEIETEDGLRFYEIEYEYNDQEYELLLDEDGEVLEKKPD